MGTWATIETKGGRSYELTDGDVLWAARMTAFEGGGDKAAVLWTMTQRFALGHWPTFTALIRAYSQPINPAWSQGGPCCCGPGTCPRGRDYCGTEHCTEAKFRRRALAKSISWEGLERGYPSAAAVTKAWAQAKVPNPVPRAISFADGPQTQRALRADPTKKLIKAAGNWFIATARSLRWPENYVTMKYGSRVAGTSSAVGGLVVLAGAGVLGYALWRRYRQ